MEKQVELEMDGRTPEEVEELNVDSCQATQISGITDEFVNLQTLSMTNNELASLKGFPKLPNLRKLDLSDNRIVNGLDALVGCPELEHVSLSGNPIKELTTLEPLKKLAALQTLELFNCDVAQAEGYRDKIFEMLESVLYVDGFDRDGEPAPDEDEVDDYDGEDGEEGLSEEEDEDSEEDGLDDEGTGEDDDDEDAEGESRGVKRKHDDEENADDA